MSGADITILIYSEKVSGEGEDAPPLVMGFGPGRGLVAVLDGMGGAGAAKVTGPQGTHSSAHYGSRIARDCLEKYVAAAHGELMAPETIDGFRLALTERFNALAAQFEFPKGRLLTKMTKRFPTTLAAIAFESVATGGVARTVSFWAGDSRCYCLTPEAGLAQLSDDDLKEGGDALANLSADSPISNHIGADAEFHINRHALTLPLPILLLAASDGCFGYVRSPMHFEALLLDTLHDSADEADWQRRLHDRIVEIAADDATLAGAALGWSTFSALRQAFAVRRSMLRERFIDPINGATRSADDAARAAAQAEQERATAIAGGWEAYAGGYYRHRPGPGEPHGDR